MPQFSVDSERVMAANGTIQATIGRLKSEVDTLHTQLIALQDSWQGQASTSFQELVVRWRTTSDSVDAQLAELGSALAYAAQQDSEIEQANQRLFL